MLPRTVKPDFNGYCQYGQVSEDILPGPLGEVDHKGGQRSPDLSLAIKANLSGRNQNIWVQCSKDRQIRGEKSRLFTDKSVAWNIAIKSYIVIQD